MGGHAFGETAARLTPSELARVTALVLAALARAGVARASSPLELADKASFGDVDVVAARPAGGAALAAAEAAVGRALGATRPPVRNGAVVSFLSAPERYQVDVIWADGRDFAATAQFLAHGDLCALVGLALAP